MNTAVTYQRHQLGWSNMHNSGSVTFTIFAYLKIYSIGQLLRHADHGMLGL